MIPTKKNDRANTYHRDGTISYWSTMDQEWRRNHAEFLTCNVASTDLAAMSHEEIDKVRKHAQVFRSGL